jgi:cytochrome P450
VSALPAAILRACDDRSFLAEPLEFLERTRSRLGDLFVLREAAPLFSRDPDCAGVVVVFGADRLRTVLSDIEAFGMPVSAAHRLTLPANLVNLNRSLHSMRGQDHASHRRILARLLTPGELWQQEASLCAALERSVDGWRPDKAMGLLEAMRSLAEGLACSLSFGAQQRTGDRLLAQLQAYFLLRREASSPGPASPVSHAELVAAGEALDRSLRSYVRACRHAPSSARAGLFALLAGEAMTEDEIVAHRNVAYISSTEPIAVSLTWILLLLTQLPALRADLRREIRQISAAAVNFDRRRLLDHVVNEALRLLPPNAFMVRTTTRATSLAGVQLPAGSEVVLCPFLVHRDEAVFPRARSFLPLRWARANPSPFEYLPFGAGGHSCVGRAVALRLIKLALSHLLERFDIALADDQAVDWRLHILFLPRNEPLVYARPADAAIGLEAGELKGPVADLIDLGKTAGLTAESI